MKSHSGYKSNALSYANTKPVPKIMFSGLAYTHNRLKKLKVGSKWKGRGKNQVATIQSIDCATVYYQNTKGTKGCMSADYFVYWYSPLAE